ncbi:uncharacterized protein PRCAT00001693001 [Priceomyces carsonii]|uniref:uncharacterized protein n=1 Tax=Priceomyces carsonii TaxID=28549 RepID=UPI002ED9E69C|nr:unnamed protein product [Priceomyces carsonii]
MPNFVSENSDEANLKSNVNHPEQVELPKHIIDNEERKSLHEQLQENKGTYFAMVIKFEY